MRFVQFVHGAYFLKIGKLRTLIHKLSLQAAAVAAYRTAVSAQTAVRQFFLSTLRPASREMATHTLCP
jgi:hypothetical protein